MAASTASVPELQKNTLSAKELETSSFARLICGSLWKWFDTCISRCACFWSATTTRGWQCPRLQTATPDTKSMYSRPSES